MYKRLILLVVLLGTILLVIYLPRDRLREGLEQIRSLGPLGPVVLALLYIPACLLFVPGSLLTVAAGFLFGIGVGTVAVSIGSVAGATAAFLLGRTLARSWVEKSIASLPQFAALDRAIASRDFLVVLLLRLSPVVPFNVLNYALGATKVRLLSFVFASWIGMLPGTFLYVYLGSGAANLADAAAGKVEGGASKQIFFWVGLAATVAVTVLVTRLAFIALKEQTADTTNPSNNASEA